MIRTVVAGDDLAKLAELHAACFSRAWTEEALRDLLKNPDTTAFAARDGFVMMRVAGEEAEILTLAVAPDMRRRGTGRTLVLRAASHAEARGARTIFLEVGDSNAAARALYKSAGFREVGRRGSYYGPSKDALILRGDLPLLPLGNPRASTRL